jgi:hypothetical protein
MWEENVACILRVEGIRERGGALAVTCRLNHRTKKGNASVWYVLLTLLPARRFFPP